MEALVLNNLDPQCLLIPLPLLKREAEQRKSNAAKKSWPSIEILIGMPKRNIERFKR